MKNVLVLLFCAQVIAGGHGQRAQTQAYVATTPQFFQQPQIIQPQVFQSQVFQPQVVQSQVFQPQVLQQPQFFSEQPQFFSAPVLLSAEVPQVFQPPAAPSFPGHGGGKHGKHQQQAQAIVVQPVVQPLITETVEERVFREPISRTVTEMPVNVNRIKKNIIQHYPMIHQQVQNHVTVEDEAVQNVIHHYYEPVNRVLPTQQGQSFMSENHVDHPGEMYVSDQPTVVQPVIQEMITVQQPVIQSSVVQNGLSEDVLAYGEEAIRPYTSASGNGDFIQPSTKSYSTAPYETTISSYQTAGSTPYQATASPYEASSYQATGYQGSPYQTGQSTGGYQSYQGSPPYRTGQSTGGYQSYQGSPYQAGQTTGGYQTVESPYETSTLNF